MQEMADLHRSKQRFALIKGGAIASEPGTLKLGRTRRLISIAEKFSDAGIDVTRRSDVQEMINLHKLKQQVPFLKAIAIKIFQLGKQSLT